MFRRTFPTPPELARAVADEVASMRHRAQMSCLMSAHMQRDIGLEPEARDTPSRGRLRWGPGI